MYSNTVAGEERPHTEVSLFAAYKRLTLDRRYTAYSLKAEILRTPLLMEMSRINNL